MLDGIPAARDKSSMIAAASERGALPALTSLRFFAAFYVLVFHALEGASGNRIVASFISTGYVAVDFFFVLSGFVLTYKYCGNNGVLVGSRKQFWSARIARVYPVYLLSLALGAPLYLHALGASHSRSTTLVLTVIAGVSALLLAQSWFYRVAGAWNPPAWSLSVEAFLYLAFPFAVPRLLARARGRGIFVFAAALWLAALAVPMLYVASNPDQLRHIGAHSDGRYLLILKYLPLLHLPSLLIGGLAGWWFLNGGRVPRAATWLASGVLVTGLCAGSWLPYPLIHNGLFALVFAIVICATASGEGPVATALGNQTLVLCGDASYALYLLHYPLLGYFHLLFGEGMPLLHFVGFFIVLQLLCIAAYKLVEVPARHKLRGILVS